MHKALLCGSQPIRIERANSEATLTLDRARTIPEWFRPDLFLPVAQTQNTHSCFSKLFKTLPKKRSTSEEKGEETFLLLDG